jgi:hypothetical protein
VHAVPKAQQTQKIASLFSNSGQLWHSAHSLRALLLGVRQSLAPPALQLYQLQCPLSSLALA